MFRQIAILLLIALGLLMLYIRLAPSAPARWHVTLTFKQDETLTNGARRMISGDEDVLARLDAIIRATPRTELLAGSRDSGHLTYVTRTKFMGFPDYTTVQLTDGTLRLFGRARFGASDLGVNAARIDGWLQALGQG